MIRTTLHRGSGQVVHIRELSKRLLRRGVDVRVFTFKATEDISQVEVEAVRFKGSNIPLIRNLGFTARCGILIKSFDLIHTQYHPAIITGNLVHALRGIPHIFTFHGYAPIRSWRNPVQKLKMIDHTLGTLIALRLGVTRVIAVSHYLKRILMKRYRLDESRISVIHNGVDLEMFKPRMDVEDLKKRYGISDSPSVLYLGRMDPYKGVDYFLRAAHIVIEQIPKAKFIIAGGSRFDRLKVQDYLTSSKIRRSIIVTGYLPESEIPLLYSACEVFCYPSMWEGFGLTPAEAQATAKPVVAFNHCAIPEVVKHGETGILVDPGDYNGLAEAIVRLLRDHDLRRRMGEEGRRRVERLFNWDEAADKTVEVYRHVAESRR
ncbi:MAG: glycosyltransferase family 4 protein [Candidatus Bathyarchaeia archaeon]|nr:glycosyltransferase family 4 protein [Candidatus Bathyarchaeota archaeon]